MSAVPLVGVTIGRRPVASSLGDKWESYVIGVEYLEALERAGAAAVLLPPSISVEAALDQCDALVLSGGDDVNPQRYGGTTSHDRQYDDARDSWEIELVRSARQRRLPTLGICRGLQIANVALGGVLQTDIARSGNHRPVVDGPTQLLERHPVTFRIGSRLTEVYGTSQRTVNSIHHQAISILAPSLQLAGDAPDGTIEAAESRDGPWFLGVQWHPEKSDDESEQRLFASLIHTAIQRSA